MKKIIIAIIALVMVTGFAFSQEQVPGFSNTVYTNVGTGDIVNNSYEEKVQFLGFIDYFTANVQAQGLTIAGDIAVNVLEGGNKLSAKLVEPANFNAIMTPFANFNFGVGTSLDWTVGPKPFSGPDYSAYKVPEYAGLPGYEGLVANHFADDAVAVRYSFEDIFVVGYGMNLGEGTNGNGIGIQANLDVVSIGFAYNGGFSESDSNIYLGASLYTVPGFDIDIWTNFDVKNSTSLGGRLAFYKDAFKLIPEFTVTFWDAENVGASFFAAIVTEMSLSREMLVGLNASWGLGADSNTENDNVDGGARINITPHFVWNITDAHRLSVGFNIINIWDTADNSDFYWGIPVAWKVLF